MVAGPLPERAQQPVRSFPRGACRPAAGAGIAICRLRGVAAAVDRRRDAAAAGRVLERGVGGCSGAFGVAVGPCAASAAELWWRVQSVRAGRELINRAEGVKPAAWSNVIHDIAGGMGGADGTVIGAGGGGDRGSCGQSGKG